MDHNQDPLILTLDHTPPEPTLDNLDDPFAHLNPDGLCGVPEPEAGPDVDKKHHIINGIVEVGDLRQVPPTHYDFSRVQRQRPHPIKLVDHVLGDGLLRKSEDILGEVVVGGVLLDAGSAPGLLVVVRQVAG